MGVCPQAEYRQDPCCLRGKVKTAVFYHGGNIILADKVAVSAPVSKKLQGLKVGNGVIQPFAVQAAVEQNRSQPADNPRRTASMESVSSFSTGNTAALGGV